MFFRRLEIYTEVPSTTEMVDIITQIMVEVLSILGIATNEIKQGRMSKFCITNMTMLTERRSEKYMKKLTGRTEIEDALKKLDNLTQEEARMAAAQNLKATHTVDERVKGVANAVMTIDNRVAGVDDQLQQTANDVDQVKRSSSNFNPDHGLTHPFREPTTREHSQMAFPTGSLYEPQYRMWYSSQERSNLVLSRQHLSGLEINRIASLGPRKTFAMSPL